VGHGDVSPLQQHIVLGDHLHSRNNYRGDNEWDLVMITDGYLPWVSMDGILFESLGLTKAYDTFQSYSQLQMFMLAFPDIFVIKNNIRGDRQWQTTWRVGRSRLPDRRIHMTHNNIGMDHQR